MWSQLQVAVLIVQVIMTPVMQPGVQRLTLVTIGEFPPLFVLVAFKSKSKSSNFAIIHTPFLEIMD